MASHERIVNSLARRKDPAARLKVATLVGYLGVVLVIGGALSIRDQNLIRAEAGLGYWLGIIGSILMLLLLIYPLVKRVRSLQRLGSVRFWFRTHMIFGVLGPLLVLIHSNFTLGSLNGRVALFCTLIVASSGVVGRYLYAKIHHGMYGQRATFKSLQLDGSGATALPSNMIHLVERINQGLVPYEIKVLDRSKKTLASVAAAFEAPFAAVRLKRDLQKIALREIAERADELSLSAPERNLLRHDVDEYLTSRVSSYRRFAQLSGCERLFGLWHIVHFPLFIIMVIAAIVHVVAVHAY